MQIDRALIKQPLGGLVHPIEGFGEFLDADRLPIQANPFRGLAQMRRCEEPRPAAVGAPRTGIGVAPGVREV